MNAFPDRRCEVNGCSTGTSVLVLLDRLICVEHFQEFELWERLLDRRRHHLRQWLLTKEPKL